MSGNRPGSHREAREAGNANRKGARVVSETKVDRGGSFCSSICSLAPFVIHVRHDRWVE